MRIFRIVLGFMITGLILLLISCEKDKDRSLNSVAGGTFSHKHGENCMDCHHAGGSGEVVFTLAGSVFNQQLNAPFTQGKVELFYNPDFSGNRQVFEIDGKGNFYTAVPVDFTEWRYTRLINGSTILEMVGPITEGNCSACHGTKTAKLWLI